MSRHLSNTHDLAISCDASLINRTRCLAKYVGQSDPACLSASVLANISQALVWRTTSSHLCGGSRTSSKLKLQTSSSCMVPSPPSANPLTEVLFSAAGTG